MSYEIVLKKYFDKVYTEIDFVKKTYEALKQLGFNAENTIACIACCRDEISQTLPGLIKDIWGEAFNLSSLAGMFFAGQTGLIAVMHHAPNVEGKERYVFYALPHIAIDAEGNLGVCKRTGREGQSSACGALNALQKEISLKAQKFNSSKLQNTKSLNHETVKPLNKIDNDDIEMSLIRMRLLREIPYSYVPDLLELTKITQQVVQKDIEHALNTIIDRNKCDYAMLTGIQIHGPDANYVAPASCYAVVNNERIELKV